MCNSVDLVGKTQKRKYLGDTIISCFNVVSMYTNIDVAVSEQFLENKINENFHLIEVSAAGIDCEVLMTLVKLCNKYSMHFNVLVNICAEHIKNWAINSYFFKHTTWGPRGVPRYMDDVILLWNYGKNELRGFLDHLNTYDRNLNFTREI